MRDVRAIGCAIVCALAVASCESATDPAPDIAAPTAGSLDRQASAPVKLTPPLLEVRTPRYPAIAVYIVYREYLHRNPGLTALSVEDRKYQNYLEKRMRQLYPERGYAGMMRDAVQEARQNRVVWDRYEADLREYDRQMATYSGAQTFSFGTASTCGSTYVDPYAGADPSWDAQEEFAVPPDEQLPTIQMEIDSLQLVGDEIDNIYYYESLAQGTYAPDGGGGGGEPIHMTGVDQQAGLDDLIRAAAQGVTPYNGDEVTVQIVPAWVAAGIVGLGVIGWKAYRVDQSVRRARQKSAEHYPNLAYDHTKRDAHRHILWSMMLRRWVGRALAKEMTDYHERDSAGRAHVMDLHNNDIGRSHRYHRFRGHYVWDRWDYGEWARKVRDYIDNDANAEYIPEWSTIEPTTAEAWAREECVPDEKYIYFSVRPSS